MRNELILLSSGVSTHLLRDVGTVGIDGVTVENLILWGQFPNTTGWKFGDNVTSGSISGNIMSFIGGGAPSSTSRNWVLRMSNDFPINVGDKIAIIFKAKAENSGTLFYVGYDYDNTSVILSTYYQMYCVIATITDTAKTRFAASAGQRVYIDGSGNNGVRVANLTNLGLASLTAAQLADLLPSYFEGKKTFGGVGCLVSKDSAEVEVGRMYFSTDPMYSNATAKDTLTYSGGKYYHTHNVDSDGNAIATPYDTEVETNGQLFLALSEGTVTYEPWYPDIAVYTDKFTLTKAITAVKELYKYGSETPITDAVIAGDGLSFTSVGLTAGDLVYGVFEFDEPLRPLMTIKRRSRKLWTDGGVGMNEIFMELLRHKIEQGQIEAEDLPQEVREQLADTTGQN